MKFIHIADVHLGASPMRIRLGGKKEEKRFGTASKMLLMPVMKRR